jgi:hypothetical protein
MKLKVDIWTRASATVEIDVPEEDIVSVAEDIGIAPEDVKLDDLIDLIHEKLEEPTICVQCSGWGKKHILELGDEWSIDGDYNEEDAEDYRPIRKIA